MQSSSQPPQAIVKCSQDDIAFESPRWPRGLRRRVGLGAQEQPLFQGRYVAEHAAQHQTARYGRERRSARRLRNADLGHDGDIGDAREYVGQDILRLSMPVGRSRVEMANSQLVGVFQHARRMPLFDAAEQTRATETQLTDRISRSPTRVSRNA